MHDDESKKSMSIEQQLGEHGEQEQQSMKSMSSKASCVAQRNAHEQRANARGERATCSKGPTNRSSFGHESSIEADVEEHEQEQSKDSSFRK